MTNNSVSLCPVLAKRSDKKSILRFYKENNYSARFIGFDSCYLIKAQDKIIASVIISKGNVQQESPPAANSGEQSAVSSTITSKAPVMNSNTHLENSITQQYLLHALFVAPHYRKQGHAEALLEHALNYHQKLVCFAKPSLAKLYLNNGFTILKDNLIEPSLPPELFIRFQQYAKHKPGLKVFIHQQNKHILLP